LVEDREAMRSFARSLVARESIVVEVPRLPAEMAAYLLMLGAAVGALFCWLFF